MRFLIAIGLALIGVVLFIIGAFQTQSAALAVSGFLVGLIGLIALRRS